ncbi:type II secretion system F family protein [Oryzihumus sp.]
MLVWVAGGAVALSLLLLVVATQVGRTPLTGMARSLALIEGPVSSHDVARAELSFGDRVAGPFLAAMRGLALRLSPSGTAARLNRLLDLAGNPPAWSLERLLAVKGAALLVGAGAGLLLGGIGPRGVVFLLAAGAAAFHLPDLLLYNAGLHRQDELRRGLADALDMLTVCVEAGQGFDSALSQVARSVTGPVAGEFARVLQEIQIGRSRPQAFASLGERSTVPEVKTFVSSLVQADRLGLPIGGVLREQAHQMRLVRRQRAEEKAQKVPVKILFPMLLGIFPALFIVIIGPGAIKMIATFSGLGG